MDNLRHLSVGEVVAHFRVMVLSESDRELLIALTPERFVTMRPSPYPQASRLAA